MKKISTMLVVLMALLVLPLVASAEEVLFDFQKNNLGLTVGTSAAEDGNISGQDIVKDGVTMRATSGGTMHARYFYLASRGNQLQIIKDGRLRFTAPDGSVITKVEFILSTAQIHWAVDKGEGTLSTDMKTWEGAATSVRFLGTGTNYIDSIKVTVQKVVTPEEDTYTPVANIAAFSELADGTLAELTLENAEVTALGIDGWTVYVQDATAGAHFYLLDQNFKAGDVINGKMKVVKYTQTGNLRIGPAEGFSADDYTVTEGTPSYTTGTVADIKTAANIGKLVKLTGVKFVTESKTKGTATDDSGSIVVYNGTSGMSPYAIKEDLQSYDNAVITGVVYNVSAGIQIYPLTIEAANGDYTFDFSASTIREKIGASLTDTEGYIYNETFTTSGTTLQVTAGSAPSRIYKDANRGQNLVTYQQYTTLTFKAPAGKAITKIAFEAAGNSNINKLTPSSGTVTGMTWEGNAEGIRFSQGATSYLANAVVTLSDKTSETVALPEIEYTECANIAEFNALAAGTYAKVTLADAEVIGKSADDYSTVWVQDATGGAWIQYTSLNAQLKENTKANGTVYVVKRNDVGKDAHMKEAEGTPNSALTFTDIADYTVSSCATIAEANAKANMLVKIEGATFTATSTTAGTLTLGDETVKVNNGGATANQQLHKLADFVKDATMENVTIVGINTVAYGILPLSIEEVPLYDVEASTIAEFNAVEDGKVVKLTLSDARVNAAATTSGYYVEDATGATVISGVTLTAGTALNGYIIGKKGSEDMDYVNDPSQGMEYSLTVEDASLSDYTSATTELTGTVMTIAEACKQENYGKLVTIKDVTISDTNSQYNKKLTDASDADMRASDKLNLLSWDYEWPASASSITGVLVYYYTAWFLMPLSEDGIVTDPTALDSIKAEALNSVIYDLQGVRQNELQKGVNIVNGKKVVVED